MLTSGAAPLDIINADSFLPQRASRLALANMDVETSLPNADLALVPELAKRIEDAGYTGVTTQENRHDPFLPLAVAAVNTTKLRLATSVAIAFPRSPMVAANLGWDLQKASKGRFELGLGTQVKGHNERRFSVPWSAPAPRLEEYVLAIKAIWQTWATGERLDFDGEHYKFNLMTPNFTPEPLDGPPPPITVAAVGPGMLRAAGRTADGVRLHAFCTRTYLETDVLPQLKKGLSQRKPGHELEEHEFTVSGGGFVCTGSDDETVSEAMDWVRYRIGFYGSTRAYWPVLERHDLLDLGEQLNHLSKNDGWDKMSSLISDDVVRLFAAVGRHDELVPAIQERFGGISRSIGIGGASGGTADGIADIPPDLMTEIHAIS